MQISHVFWPRAVAALLLISHAPLGGVCTTIVSVSVPLSRARGMGVMIRLTLRGGGEEGGPLMGERILSSLKEAEDYAAEYARVDQAAIDAFAAELDVAKVRRASKLRFQLPLRFDTEEQEVNWHAVRNALAFVSGWQEITPPRYGDKGVPHRDTIVHGLMTLHMEGNPLSADSLRDLQLFACGQAFGVPLTQEKRLDGGPIRQDVPSDHRTFIDRIHSTMLRVTEECVARGFTSLADFCTSLSVQGHVRPDEAEDPSLYTAQELVKRLAACFETFQDEDELDCKGEKKKVIFNRKAQALAEDLYVRFGAKDARFNFTDIDTLILGSDAETVAILRRKGVIVVDETLQDRIAKGRNILSHGAAEVSLRVAGALSCRRLAEKLSEKGLGMVTCCEVYRYLDLLVKDCYMQKVKVIEEEEERKREERGGDRIVEIDDEADEEEKHSKGLMSGEWGPAVPHHICQQTHHY